MKQNNNHLAFFSLLRAGLWEQNISLSTLRKVDYDIVQQLANEQSVVGVLAAGVEQVVDVKIPQEVTLSFVGNTLMLEQRNSAMNTFLADLIERLRTAGVYALLLKGQGIAQCYERPLWRASGDVDLLLSEENYRKAKKYLIPISSSVEEEYESIKHLGLTVGNWEVELHGTTRSELWRRIDRILNQVQNDVFCGGNVRTWMNGHTQIFLPRADEDVVFVFAHILQHYFKEGVGLRQICDWCRLLWTYNETLDKKLLEQRIREMGVMTEWKTFAYLAVHNLGMPEKAMFFYSPSRKWKSKAGHVLNYILETGNMGHNRDYEYQKDSSALRRKTHSFYHITCDSVRQFMVFPLDSIKVWWYQMLSGLHTLNKHQNNLVQE